MYLSASATFAMKVTALHLWSIFTPKSGANAKEREGRMHFGVAQRFAALIAGVKQTSLKLSAKASAGLPSPVHSTHFAFSIVSPNRQPRLPLQTVIGIRFAKLIFRFRKGFEQLF